MSKLDVEQVRALAAQGLTDAQIGERVGRVKRTVRLVRARHAIPSGFLLAKGPDNQTAVLRLHAEGRYAELNKIAADLGITPAEVTRRWHALRSRMRGGLSVWAVIVADLD